MGRVLWSDLDGMKKYVDARLSDRTFVPPPLDPRGESPGSLIIDWIEQNTYPEMRTMYHGLVDEKFKNGVVRGLSGLLDIAIHLKDELIRDKVLDWAFPHQQRISPDFYSVHTAGATLNYGSIGDSVASLIDVTTGKESFGFYGALISTTPDITIAHSCLFRLYRRKEGRDDEAREIIRKANERFKGKCARFSGLAEKFVHNEIH